MQPNTNPPFPYTYLIGCHQSKNGTSYCTLPTPNNMYLNFKVGICMCSTCLSCIAWAVTRLPTTASPYPPFHWLEHLAYSEQLAQFIDPLLAPAATRWACPSDVDALLLLRSGLRRGGWLHAIGRLIGGLIFGCRWEMGGGDA